MSATPTSLHPAARPSTGPRRPRAHRLRLPAGPALALAAGLLAGGCGLDGLDTLPTSALPSAPGGGAAVAMRLDPATQRVTVDDPSPTVSAVWDRVLQDAIARKSPGPTISARAFAVLHTALYDTWASVDPVAVGVVVGNATQVPPGQHTEVFKREAMSHCAFRVLGAMFPQDRDRFAAVMATLGYDPEAATRRGTAPGLGMVVAALATAPWRADGSNWDEGFADPGGYAPVNHDPLTELDIARWTPENRPIDPESTEPDQEFYTPHWGRVRSFAIGAPGALRPPPPEPLFAPGVKGRLDPAARTVTLADGRVLPVGRALVGPVINPRFVAQAEEVVALSAGLTDRQKMIAEFWEDANGTSFPPGTWMTFAQYVSARDDHGLDEDARLFLVMANAMHDAAVATWEAKRHYDYARPVRVIRDLGRLGLIGEPGRDELTGEQGHVIRAWGGPGLGTRTILATRFLTYQTPDLDPSPPFPEYPSGHSSFSAAGAEVLRAMTGSDRFGAGVRFEPGSSRFEPGVTPRAPVVLSWETFSQAADEAGISRRYGGIHFEDGDMAARALGRKVGRAVLERAAGYFRGAGG